MQEFVLPMARCVRSVQSAPLTSPGGGRAGVVKSLQQSPAVKRRADRVAMLLLPSSRRCALAGALRGVPATNYSAETCPYPVGSLEEDRACAQMSPAGPASPRQVHEEPPSTKFGHRNAPSWHACALHSPCMHECCPAGVHALSGVSGSTAHLCQWLLIALRLHAKRAASAAATLLTVAW